MLGFAALTPTYLEHAARMRFGCDRSDFFRDDYLRRSRTAHRLSSTRPIIAPGIYAKDSDLFDEVRNHQVTPTGQPTPTA